MDHLIDTKIVAICPCGHPICNTRSTPIEDENGTPKAVPTIGQTGVVYVRRREDNNQISLTLSLSNQATLEDAFKGVL